MAPVSPSPQPMDFTNASAKRRMISILIPTTTCPLPLPRLPRVIRFFLCETLLFPFHHDLLRRMRLPHPTLTCSPCLRPPFQVCHTAFQRELLCVLLSVSLYPGCRCGCCGMVKGPCSLVYPSCAFNMVVFNYLHVSTRHARHFWELLHILG